MLENEPTDAQGVHTPDSTTSSEPARRTRKRAASRPAGPPTGTSDSSGTSASAGSEAAGDTGSEAAPDKARNARRPRKSATRSKGTANPESQAEVEANSGAAAQKASEESASGEPAPAKKATAKKTTAKKTTAKKTTAKKTTAKKTTAKKTTAKKTAAKKATTARASGRASADTSEGPAGDTTAETDSGAGQGAADQPEQTSAAAAPVVLFQPPAAEAAPRRRRRRSTGSAESADDSGATAEAGAAQSGESTEGARATEGAKGTEPADAAESSQPSGDGSSAEGEDAGQGGGRRRRRRGGRGRRRRGGAESGETSESGEDAGSGDASATGQQRRDDEQASGPEESAEAAESVEASESTESAESGEGSSSRRRRRRRRRSEDGESVAEDSSGSSSRSRSSRRGSDNDVASVKGSTRLEAKKQRRREGREANRRRPPLLTEAEFLARREAVDRVMLVRQSGARTQIAVLEDGILVEHYVTREQSSSYVGNVYLGKVQNVLPSMEAAFVDIGKGRNAVLYAGEVNWDAAGLDGQPKRIEQALKSGDSVLVQVTKDPIGHKGARLTSQVSIPGRFLVYVPDGSMTGISRKLPDTERSRLKRILRQVLPENAGVIVRTAAEGASEQELSHDVARLTAQWEDIEKKARTASAPAMLHAEPDLTVRVIRDIFNEDFSRLVVSGEDAWATVSEYVKHVAPDMLERVAKWTETTDVFTDYRVDEQLVKALDRKVWLPSGGYLIIDRTEAMVVVDVNTGKFTGKGGNLEETVTKNNLEAAEEIVRQLRLRDLGGIIVIDFIDMVLESNRDLVLRRLVECLGRDRTRHQVAEVTSLGLVQMTRKRIGQGLLEAFSSTCEACGGRGVKVSLELGEPRRTGQSGRVTPAMASAAIAAAGNRPKETQEPAEAGEADVTATPEDAAEPASELRPESTPEPTSESASESTPEPESQPAPVKRRTRRRATAPAGQPGVGHEHAAPATEPGLV